MARHAVVTGGSRGIGAAVTRRLLADGLRVTALSRSGGAPDGAAGRAVDVTDEAAMAEAIGALGIIDILVNNAGGAESAPFARQDAGLVRRMLALNLESAFTACRLVMPGMLARGSGRIVNIASTAGLKGYPYVAAYVAAKHGVIGLTRALALEVAKAGVTVNAVCPGFTETELVATRARRRGSAGRARALEPGRSHGATGRGRGRRGLARVGGSGGGERHRAACRRRRDRMMDGGVIDAETKALERPRDHKDEVRLWLRLFTCTTMIENEIRRRLRENFGFTLPRFDMMAQLHNAERDLSLGDLSPRKMVTNGNVTALVESLVQDGVVERRASPLDKRAVLVRLTPEGTTRFEAMAAAHEGWIADLTEDLDPEDREQLMRLLGKLKRAVRVGSVERDPS